MVTSIQGHTKNEAMQDLIYLIKRSIKQENDIRIVNIYATNSRGIKLTELKGEADISIITEVSMMSHFL
jgi:hypothetical protein